MVFLYGAPASGKTTLGKALAEKTSLPHIDLDAEIVRAAGAPIPRIFEERGEAAFRDLESAALEETARSAPQDAVVSLGGGTLLRDSNRRLCESRGAVFCIDAPDGAELARRIGAAAGSRPLGDRAKERAAHYASFPRRVASFFETGGSLVVVGRGIAEPLLAGRNAAVDENVARLHAKKLPKPVAIVPSGEEHKTISTVCSLWSAFAAAGLGRKDRVAAVGGGVAGDLTGFAAATWMRGIAWMNFPTTLLSMVDASTGGKTGCDLPEGKNLAGAFHSPLLVVADVDFLETLPPALLAAGRAEMIKHETIGGLPPGSAQGIPTAAEIAANLSVKAQIVREDPFETKGRRILLNCGHTVAHAVEKATRYAVSHGEAVAIGCVEEARLAVRLGLADRGWPDALAARFAAAGLPNAMPDGLSFDSLKPLMRGDKKRRGDVVEFALPCAHGDVRATPVDLSEEA